MVSTRTTPAGMTTATTITTTACRFLLYSISSVHLLVGVALLVGAMWMCSSWLDRGPDLSNGGGGGGASGNGGGDKGGASDLVDRVDLLILVELLLSPLLLVQGTLGWVAMHRYHSSRRQPCRRLSQQQQQSPPQQQPQPRYLHHYPTMLLRLYAVLSVVVGAVYLTLGLLLLLHPDQPRVMFTNLWDSIGNRGRQRVQDDVRGYGEGGREGGRGWGPGGLSISANMTTASSSCGRRRQLDDLFVMTTT